MIQNLPEEELFAKGHRACAGCGSALAIRHILKAAGKDVIVCQATGCMEVVSSPYPNSAWKVPWIHAAFENVSAVASGVERALKKLNKKTKVLAIGGDGGTFDIGFQALSGAIERGHDFCYVNTDNEAYMNTGIQRSGATPLHASTTTSPFGKKIHGKLEPKKPMPLIVAAHGVKYVATASIAKPLDLYCPCPPGWKIATNQTVEVAKIGIKARVTPLYEIENGKLKLENVEENVPVESYLKLQGRFKRLDEKDIKEIQEYVDARWKFLVEASKLDRVFDVLH